MTTSTAVSLDRWETAQAAEAAFWAKVRYEALTVSRTLAAVTEFAVWVSSAPGLRGPWVELGIGPLGLGSAHLMRAQSEHVVGVDPLDLIPDSEMTLPEPLLSALRECHAGYTHVVAKGEATKLPSHEFGMVVMHNVLDHVQDPAAVLAESVRLVRPAGHVAISCDVFSALGKLKATQYDRRRHRGSLFVDAHPFRFTRADLEALIRGAGLDIETVRHEGGRLQELAGGVGVVYVLARPSA